MSGMANRKLIRELDTSEDGRQFEATFNEPDCIPPPVSRGLVSGLVLRITEQEVCIDVGARTPGVVPRTEWEGMALPCPRDKVEVLIESIDEESGTPRLSYLNARLERLWGAFVERHKVGDTVTATVTRQMIGGFQVDVGYPAFLPNSQVDIRRPPNLAEFVGRILDCMILVIDEVRRNVLVSRRRLLEIPLQQMRTNLLAEIEPGQTRAGVVRNIAEFGAFVDLGGIDGLLHVTDMAWSRVNHPREVVQIDETIEVYVLSVDLEKEKITLSLKHKTPNPWPDLTERFPVGSRHVGEVVNVVSYGAWVKLPLGPDGLIHISELSWTRHLATPADFVAIGDEIEVQVLSVKPETQDLALSMKAVLPNIWARAAERYPPGAMVVGEVRQLTSYWAFVDLEPGIDGLVHLSEFQKTRAVNHPNEVVNRGDPIACVVLKVDVERRRITLGLRDQPAAGRLAVQPPPMVLRIPGEVLEWKNGLVKRMARDIREGRTFDELPILADALEDAGCVEEAVLAHLRDGGPHARRCWVLDLILDQK
jgi:small subunit ribosomal protein S1